MTITLEQVSEAQHRWLDAVEATRIAGAIRLSSLRGTSKSPAAIGDPGAPKFEACLAEEQALKAAYDDLLARYTAQQSEKRERATLRLAVANTLLAVAIMIAAAVQAWAAFKGVK